MKKNRKGSKQTLDAKIQEKENESGGDFEGVVIAIREWRHPQCIVRMHQIAVPSGVGAGPVEGGFSFDVSRTP